MNKTKLITLIIITAALFAQCNKPELIVFNRSKTVRAKSIRLNRISIKTLNFDPFVKEEVKDLVSFELEKNGYKAVKETSGLTNTSTDSSQFCIVFSRKSEQEVTSLFLRRHDANVFQD